MTISRKHVMMRAWEIKASNIRRFGKTANDYNRHSWMSFGDCLRSAWAEAKNSKRIYDNTQRMAAEEAEKEAARQGRTFRGFVTIGYGRKTIEVNVWSGYVTGHTYDWRKEIKSFGGEWSADERAWCLPLNRVQDFCRQYA